MTMPIKTVSLILVPVVLVAALFGLMSLAKLKSVNITGSQSCLNQAELFEKTQIANKNLLLLSKVELKEEISQKFPCTTEVKIEKKYPSTIVINISTATPVAQIADSPFGVTGEGLVIGTQDPQNLPKLFLPQEIKIEQNKKIDDGNILLVLHLIENLQKSDFTPTQIRLVDNVDIIIYSQAEAKALFTTTKDPAAQVDSLQSVLAKAKIDASKISQIDLRFNKPVITYKQ